jgi:hypothetical protein
VGVSGSSERLVNGIKFWLDTDASGSSEKLLRPHTAKNLKIPENPS